MAISHHTIPNSSGIYQIRCLVNGKIYVGSAVNIRERCRLHFVKLNSKRHHSKHLQNAWELYGDENFVIDVLKHVEVPENLITTEQEFLDQLRPFDRGIGYNTSPTAGSRLGARCGPHTPEHRAKISAGCMGNKSNTGRNLTPEHRAKLIGRKHTPEAKAKMSEARKGRVISEETRTKLRGRKHSDETKSRMSEALKEAWARRRALGQTAPTSEALENIAKASQKSWARRRAEGRTKRTPEQCAKMVETSRRVYAKRLESGPVVCTAETRAKMSAARRAFWERRRLAARDQEPLPKS